MKNRVRLRVMDVDGEKYLWSYNYDDMDFVNYPYSYYLFVPQDNKKLKVRVYFTRYSPNMKIDAYSDEGTPCFYGEEKIILNLCRPYFARQILEYVFDNLCSKSDTGEIDIKDGDSILYEMGYRNFY
ncbi:MAG: hypothetical protein K2G36_00245 [Ruminococcus sp.]|nr:hypothetical protein [Ruminococcus sp.]